MTEEKQNHENHEDHVAQLRQYLENAQANLHQAYHMLSHVVDSDELNVTIKDKLQSVSKEELTKNTKIVEGVFDGQNMIGPDGKVYTIPPNYASKSKLVEGDILKLTIMPDGSFLYKQIGPVERKRLVGTLMQDENSKEFRVLAKGRTYKVILASVTYFKGDVGSQAVVLVPKDQDSQWAAIENVIREGQALEDGDDIELPSGDEMELEGGEDKLLTI